MKKISILLAFIMVSVVAFSQTKLLGAQQYFNNTTYEDSLYNQPGKKPVSLHKDTVRFQGPAGAIGSVGKVLTSVDNLGTAIWQAPAAPSSVDSLTINGNLSVTGKTVLGQNPTDTIWVGIGIGKPNGSNIKTDTNGVLYADTVCKCIDTVENGLTRNNGNLRFGGTLIGHTAIDLATYRLKFNRGLVQLFTLGGDALLPAYYDGLYYALVASNTAYSLKIDSQRITLGRAHLSNGSYATLFITPYAGSSPDVTPDIILQTTACTSCLRSGISMDRRSTEIFLLDPADDVDVAMVQVDSGDRTINLVSLKADNATAATKVVVDTFGIKFIHNNASNKGYIFPTDTPTAIGQTITVTATDGTGNYSTSWSTPVGENIYTTSGIITDALRIVIVQDDNKLLFGGDGELEIATSGGVNIVTDSIVTIQGVTFDTSRNIYNAGIVTARNINTSYSTEAFGGTVNQDTAISLYVYTSGSGRSTFNLDANAPLGTVVTVKDGSGSASALTPITLDSGTGNDIDASQTYALITAWGFVTVKKISATLWVVLSKD